MLAGDICEFLPQLNLRKTQGLGSALKALRLLTPSRDLHLRRLSNTQEEVFIGELRGEPVTANDLGTALN